MTSPDRSKKIKTSFQGEFEPRILTSDDAHADVALRRRRTWICKLLKGWAHVSIDCSAGGVPWIMLYDLDGYGTPVTFGGLAAYAVAMVWRSRIMLDQH